MESRVVARYIAVLTVVLVIRGSDATVSVYTKLGRIIGSEETLNVRGQQFTLKTFLGIPYALSTGGERRFEKPVPAEPFKEDFMATKFGPVCPQLENPLFEPYDYQSEDCLSLNIYVPVQPADQGSGHAVMVFIHGGGFEMGTGESYVGDQLAALGNVIVVTINYRLGIFGFLSTGDRLIPGNMGLFDQHVALQWINTNIAAFEGDANRVTIFGESAGGTSVFFQGLYPANKGLFQRIISESGVPSLGGAVNSNPKPQFDFVSKGFGCESDSVEQSIKCLKGKDTDAILNGLKDMMAEVAEDPANALFVHFLVTTDGDLIKSDALPAKVSQLAKTDVLPMVEFYRSLDAMVGYNNNDGAFLLAVPGFIPSISDFETFLPSRQEFTDQLIHMPIYFNFPNDVIPYAVRSLIISHYTDWSDPIAPSGNRDNYVQLWTDIFFGNGANEYTRMHANATDKGNTYMYLFSAPPSLHVIPTPSWIEGANHGDELPFVFGFGEKLIKAFNKSLVYQPKEWELELSRKVILYWSNFAKSGNPNEPANIYPAWPSFDMAEQKAINLEKDMSDESKLRFVDGDSADFWMEILPAVMNAIKNTKEGCNVYSAGTNSETCDSDKGCGNN